MLDWMWLQHEMEILDIRSDFSFTEIPATRLLDWPMGNTTLETQGCNSTVIKLSTITYSPVSLKKFLFLGYPKDPTPLAVGEDKA